MADARQPGAPLNIVFATGERHYGLIANLLTRHHRLPSFWCLTEMSFVRCLPTGA